MTSSAGIVASIKSAPPPKRRRLRYTIRSLLVLTAVAAVLAAVAGLERREYLRQARIAAELVECGYDVGWEEKYFGLSRRVVVVKPTVYRSSFYVPLAGEYGQLDPEIWYPKWAERLAPTLCQFYNLKALRELSLAESGIDDSHLPLIARCTNLQQLDLSRTLITDRGLENLAELKQLVRLDLSFTAVTDQGMAHLARLDNLRYLCLSNSNVGDEGVASLQRAIPGLKINY
jgi:Leucine Rich repeat